MNFVTIEGWLGCVVIAAPAVLVICMACAALFSLKLSERAIAHLTQACVVAGLLAAVVVLLVMLSQGSRHIEVEIGNWATVHSDQAGETFHFHLEFVFDRLSVPFVILSFVLVGTIGAFAHRYLHRETGYERFFTLYSLFLLGMIVAALAGTVETLFLGWELVGLSSALLVAFFQDRPAPVRNGLQVWSIYRVADAAFLIAAIALHHAHGAGDFSLLMGEGAWPYGKVAMQTGPAIAIGMLLLLAAAGKSALFPFSEWLPKAMEGPTPSSAVFYGALSVHLGVYLLLRISPLLEVSWILRAAVIALGLWTAIYAARVEKVQTDVKTALAFASLTQVGLITMEIGFGLSYFALAHMIGHASLRSLQLLRAANALEERSAMENAVGGRLAVAPSLAANPSWPAADLRWYRYTFNRGWLDNWLDRLVVRPFLAVFQSLDSLETAWIGLWDVTPEPEKALSPASNSRKMETE